MRRGPEGSRIFSALVFLALMEVCGPSTLARDMPSGWAIEPDSLRSDPRMRALLAVVESARSEALDDLSHRFALSGGRLSIRWKFTSHLPRTAGNRVGFEAGRTQVGPRAITVILPARRYLERPRKVRPVVAHEAAHALLASQVGDRERYLALPFWFREGLALLGSGEGESRVAQRIARTVVHGEAPDSFLRGIRPGRASGTTPTATPAESYLAVRSLVRRLGDRGLKALLQDLSGSPDPAALVARAPGMPGEEWRLLLRREARQRVAELAPPSVGVDFRRGLAHLEKRELAAARRVFSSLCGRRDAGALLTSSRYFLGRAHMAAGEVRQASVELERLISRPSEGLWEAEALNSLAECCLAAGEERRARAYLDESLERFPDDARAVTRARTLLEELRRSGSPRRGAPADR